jgi:hypothetical protein
LPVGSLVKSIVTAAETVDQKKKNRRLKRDGTPRKTIEDHFIQVYRDTSRWNTHDFVCYWQALCKSVFGFKPSRNITRSAGQMKFFMGEFVRKGVVDKEDVKYAMQIYFSRLDNLPETFGLMTSARSINEIKENWDYPLSLQVMDRKVFREYKNR